MPTKQDFVAMEEIPAARFITSKGPTAYLCRGGEFWAISSPYSPAPDQRSYLKGDSMYGYTEGVTYLELGLDCHKHERVGSDGKGRGVPMATGRVVALTAGRKG